MATHDVSFDETLSDARSSAVSGIESVPPPSEPDSLVGSRLHHFRIVRPLGSGGMGAVYVARDESLEREVALKVLHPEYASDPSLRERFVREARAQARLHNPNVVQVYYIGQEDTRLFFAMEMVEGLAMDKYVEQLGHPLPVGEALDAMEGVARALREAHQRGFVHRDIKPGNLLRSTDGIVKLADFGLARPISTDSKITQSGMVIGSPAYMSPEQALGAEVDHRSDMYSLGATFFHLLTGRQLYDGPTPIATITKHCTEPLPNSEAFGDMPAPVEELLRRMLAKKQADRFDTYDALLAAITQARPRTITYAGVPTRMAVLVFDHLTFIVLAAVFRLWAVPLFTAYVVTAITWRGQTLGDRLFRVQVTSDDGGRVPAAQSFWRHLVSHWFPVVVGMQLVMVDGARGLERMVTDSVRMETNGHAAFGSSAWMVGAAMIWNAFLFALYGIGMATAIFDRRKRALHDMAAGTVVTYRL